MQPYSGGKNVLPSNLAIFPAKSPFSLIRRWAEKNGNLTVTRSLCDVFPQTMGTEGTITKK